MRPLAQWECPARGPPAHDADVRFTRHARNRLRFFRLSVDDISALVWADAGWISQDESGNIEVTGFIRGHCVTAVLAGDEPDLVITIIGERGRRP